MDKNTIFRGLLIVAAAAILFMLITYYNKKQTVQTAEKFWNSTVATEKEETLPANKVGAPSVNHVDTAKEGGASGNINGVAPAEEEDNEDWRNVDFETQELPGDCFPKDRLTAEDLLPKDAANSKWAQVNPAGQGDVKDQNFLSAGYLVGVNTVGSSLKNANLQLRSEPVIPKVSVGPFLNSSYEASDATRRPLEIGGEC